MKRHIYFQKAGNLRFMLEARVGFEPTNRGFADPSLSHLGTAPCVS